ncbi:methyltransferase domain-containing protein [Lentzea cavernae]|uniref:Ubiquinone biosynthesis O-methyltransferase n=1 Tax=Lentzea cavernae TaxID=2020703 RepID=A0ABQ3MBC9_9PSEU|nr:methyltransferase domain-containing protein [Lentzea cavernae]GHH33525.1 ubiquinone biosynthesis O-methyltransferase [Lentzea cavernae]
MYERLAEHWWDPRGPFVMLHWLAAARARLVPRGPGDAVLVDLGCGAGLLAPHVHGYHHIGVDLSREALRQAGKRGVSTIEADVLAVPLPDGCADVVVAGEILEHVPDLTGAVAEACRVLRPGGLLVLDTLADTALCRFVAVVLAERVGLAPRGVHDPALFVDRNALVSQCARHGVHLVLRGIRPSLPDLLAWSTHRGRPVRMVPTTTTAVLFQGAGRKKG